MTMQRSEDIGVGLTMTLTSEVTEATEAGSTVEMTVDAIDAESPAGAKTRSLRRWNR